MGLPFSMGLTLTSPSKRKKTKLPVLLKERRRTGRCYGLMRLIKCLLPSAVYTRGQHMHMFYCLQGKRKERERKQRGEIRFTVKLMKLEKSEVLLTGVFFFILLLCFKKMFHVFCSPPASYQIHTILINVLSVFLIFLKAIFYKIKNLMHMAHAKKAESIRY